MINPFGFLPTGLRWTRKMFDMLRELRTHEQRVLSSRDLITDELRQNARVLDEWASHQDLWNYVRERLTTERWRQYEREVSIFRKRHPELWRQLVRVYGELELAAGSPRTPRLNADDLYDLATRLDEAEL